MNSTANLNIVRLTSCGSFHLFWLFLSSLSLSNCKHKPEIDNKLTGTSLRVCSLRLETTFCLELTSSSCTRLWTGSAPTTGETRKDLRLVLCLYNDGRKTKMFDSDAFWGVPLVHLLKAIQFKLYLYNAKITTKIISRHFTYRAGLNRLFIYF